MKTREERREISQVKHLLRALGKTPERVALNLDDLKIKGHRGEAKDCPVANYLRKQTGNSYTVSNSYIMRVNQILLMIETPKPVADFIREFDSGQHSYLGS